MTKARLARATITTAATVALICFPHGVSAQENPGTVDVSGQAFVESNKTFPTGRVLVDGPYLNLLATGRYVRDNNQLTLTGIFGTPLHGARAGIVNKINVNLCGSHAAQEITAQICTTHYFNPDGRPFDDVYAVVTYRSIGFQVGDTNVQDEEGPYIEAFFRGESQLDERHALRWRVTAAHTKNPDLVYGALLVELSRFNGPFVNLHIYHQEGYRNPDVTIRVGIRF